MSSDTPPAKRDDPGHKDSREVEWQLASSDLSSVRRWIEDHATIDGLVLQPQPTLKIFDTYFDTDDWRIYRAGFALRIRSEDGKAEATLKSLRSNSTEMADRREVSEKLQSGAAESIGQSTGPVGTRVHAVSGLHALQPLFEVHTSRQRYAVHTPQSDQPVGEIALDETVIARPRGQPQTSIQRVEVEALTDAHEPLQSLVKTLRTNCGLESASDSKYSQGLKSVGLAPATDLELEPTAVDATMRMDEIACANLRRYLSEWHRHEPGARLGDDPEELHDLRVAGRRLDAILRQFAAYVPASLVRIRSTLKKLMRALGDARDLDVALLELAAFSHELPEAERSNIEPLRQHLLAERARARSKMLAALDSSATQKDFERLLTVLAQPTGSAIDEQQPDAVPAVPAAKAIPELVRTRYKKMRKGANRLTPDSSMDAYHAVRGRVKKFRYALESVAGVLGKPAADMLRSLRRWQEKLGQQQDADVAGRRLRALATHPPKGLPPETLFLMGELAAHYRRLAAKSRKRHPRTYRKVQTRWKALKSRLEALGASNPPPPPEPAAEP
jgi:CHAD domain-containing protein